MPKAKLSPQPKVHPNSLEVMKNRHLRKNKKGELIETPADCFYRVAKAIAEEDAKYIKDKSKAKTQIEQSTQRFYKAMARNEFFPGSRVLFEAGNPDGSGGQLSSCFVLPIEDSIDGIFETMKDAAIVQKNNGGTGFNFSHIRPKGDYVGDMPNIAAGPIHYLKSFSTTFDKILQGGKRGGGNMAILNVSHPDIEELINLKGQDDSIRNFNISIGASDAFMKAVEGNKKWNLVNPRNGKTVKKIDAKELFDLICYKAWECADPGLFFNDTTQNANPTKPEGIIEATNPCGEEPLRAYESCNLGSINVSTHIVNGKMNWTQLRESARTGTHFLENMIDASRFPLQKIANEVNKTRKLGVGIMGLGDAFYKLGIPYNSQKGVNFAAKLMDEIQEACTKESEVLAKERGTFPAYKGSKWEKMGRRVRNATMTSIAPTGTLSLVAHASSGCEPTFSLVYERRSFYQDSGKEKEMKTLLYVNEIFEEVAKQKGFYSKNLMKKIAENGGTLKGIKEIPEEVQKVFVTTHDIEPQWHIKMQAVLQKNVDAAVSKTINFPHNANVNDVQSAYMQAWKEGCKGITIYRDGSKSFQVLSTTKSSTEPGEKDPGKITKQGLSVLKHRALARDDNGKVIESPEQLWRRIAGHMALAEKVYKRSAKQIRREADEFYQILSTLEFQSGGALIFAGMGKEALLSKCFVLPIEDNIDSIFKTLNQNIQVLRRGGGTGFNFSKLRSTYSRVKTTGEHAAGPLEYLKVYNRAQDTIIGRGGRQMGSMAILNVDHPNIEEFIHAKDEYSEISHYNISVGITDEFMDAVVKDKDWDLIDPHDNKIYKTIRAQSFFREIAKHAWISGDPGLAFIDEMERKNTISHIGKIDATNPCGEQPLIPYESCNLGNIDVSKMVQGFPFVDDPGLFKMSVSEKFDSLYDWDRLEYVTKVGTRFLDNIIDVNNYPIPEIEEMTKAGRNIGIGVMGFADTLIKLGISYSSDDALEAAERIMSFINDKSHEESQRLGNLRGNFTAFKGSLWDKSGVKNMRNARTTTIAPTGTISIVAGCHPGIEPIFALVYRIQNSMGGTDQIMVDRLFEEVAKVRGFYSDELMEKVADGTKLTLIEEIPDDVAQVFVTAHHVPPEQHVKIQAAFQKHVDSGVSKTINLPEETTPKKIEDVYKLAYELGCKGITVFRDGAKAGAQVVGKKRKGHKKVTSRKKKK